MKFRPFLAPNKEINLSEIKYPLLASMKLDGVRCIIKDGQILTRSLKSLPNRQLNEKFEALRKFTKLNDCIFDGEIYSHELTFQEIMSFCMTDDLTDLKSIKKNGGVLEIPEHLKFHCFDMIKDKRTEQPFIQRYELSKEYINIYIDIACYIKQEYVESKEEVLSYFDEVLKRGYEGLILKNPHGRYKCGRGTINEGLIYKVKPFISIDAQIISVIQATEVNDDAEKIINEIGQSVTSKKKDDRHTIDKASAFMVYYKGQELKVTLSLTDKEKKEIWMNKDSYIGRWIEYKAMEIGMKENGLPRHPVYVRYRDDKNKTEETLEFPEKLGIFSFLNNEEEDIYSESDGNPLS